MSRQIVAKDNDLKIVTKVIDFLAEGHEIETSRTFLEIKDARGRAFRYVSMTDRPHESNGKMENRIDGDFHDMLERMADKSKPGTSLHAYLEDDEDDQEEEDEEEGGSDQED